MSQAGERSCSTLSESIWGCIRGLLLPFLHRLIPSLSCWVTFMGR